MVMSIARALPPGLIALALLPPGLITLALPGLPGALAR
jgi:hypothetical protein